MKFGEVSCLHVAGHRYSFFFPLALPVVLSSHACAAVLVIIVKLTNMHGHDALSPSELGPSELSPDGLSPGGLMLKFAGRQRHMTFCV